MLSRKMNKQALSTQKPTMKREHTGLTRDNKEFSLSPSTPADHIFYLQETIGNRAVQRLLYSGFIQAQAKLKIGQPGDIYEQEADRVADAVMRMPEPQGPETEEDKEEALQAEPMAKEISPNIQRQTLPEEELIQNKPSREQVQPILQRQNELEEEEEVQRKAEEDEEEELQITPAIRLKEEDEETEEEPLIQTKRRSSAEYETNTDLEGAIRSMRTGGQPLPESVRTFFEPRFGQDFSQVRVHTGPKAVESARTLNARAYTLGRDIVFGAEQYAPATSRGQRLIAHELTHVVQQDSYNRRILRETAPSPQPPPGSTTEKKAIAKVKIATITIREGDTPESIVKRALVEYLKVSEEDVKKYEIVGIDTPVSELKPGKRVNVNLLTEQVEAIKKDIESKPGKEGGEAEEAKEGEAEGLGETIADIMTDWIPGASNIKDATIALTGVNPVTEEKVGVWGRILAAICAIPVLGSILKYIGKGAKLLFKAVRWIGRWIVKKLGLSKIVAGVRKWTVEKVDKVWEWLQTRILKTKSRFNASKGYRHALGPVKGGRFTRAGHQLTKHPNIVGAKNAAELTKMFGNQSGINKAAADALENIMTNGTKTIKNTKAYGKVIDFKLPNRLGARFNAETSEFIGWLGRGL